jgi:hypothetical protein
MSRNAQKEVVVTFKADASLVEALKVVQNRSNFIRTAILSALGSHCPLCGGDGVLTPNQKRHWDEFVQHHPLEECSDCHEVHITCHQERADGMHADSEEH